MWSILRQPGNLARMSRRAAEHVYTTRRLPIRAAQIQVSAFIDSNRVRSYATVDPGGPKPDGDDNNENNKKKMADEGSKNNGGGGTGGKNEIPPSTPPSPGEQAKPESKLSEEEEKQVDKLMEHMKPALPKSQQKALEDMRRVLRKDGMPPELKAFIQKHIEEGKPASLTEYIQLARAMAQHASETLLAKEEQKSGASKEGKKKGKEEEEKQQQQQQEGQKEGQRQQKNKSNGDQNFKIFDFRMDPTNFIISAFVSYYVYRSIVPPESYKEITWQEFRANFLDKGLVEKLTVVNKNNVRVELYRDALVRVYPDSPAAEPNFRYYFTIGSVESFERKLEGAQVELGIPSAERIPVAYVDEVPWIATLMSFGPTLLLIGTFFWVSRRATGASGGRNGIFGIGKSRARRFNQETDIKIRFSDIAGMDEAKTEIMEFVSFLKQPERFQRLGAKIPRGAILSGAPGTGKTLLAKATAGESGVPFFSVSGSEFVEMFVGVGPSRVRDLFANARKNTPCIIFIDEIDAIGKSRAKQNYGGGNDERESTLNQILTEMDGFNTTDQVVVLAGTNRPDVLDKALMRPGRFDRHISIDRPTMDGRKQIFGVYLKKIVSRENMEYLAGRLAALTPGFAGADIANCVNEAALIGRLYLFSSLSLSLSLEFMLIYH